MEKTMRPYKLQKNKYRRSWKLSAGDKAGIALTIITIGYIAIRVALG